MSGTPRRFAITIAWFWVLSYASLGSSRVNRPATRTADPAVMPASHLLNAERDPVPLRSNTLAGAVQPRPGVDRQRAGGSDRSGIAAALALVGRDQPGGETVQPEPRTWGRDSLANLAA